jgi:hypothetical protein
MRNVLIFGSLVLAVAAAASYWQHRRPLEYGFENRGAKSPSFFRTIFPGILPRQLVENHEVVVERALLIRDPKVVDDLDFDSDPSTSQGGPWTFANVFAQAINLGQSSAASSSQIQMAADQWSSDLTTKVSPDSDTFFQGGVKVLFEQWPASSGHYPLNAVPLRLLAVVNRIDLAHSDTKMCPQPGQDMQGAEIRFVYQGIGPTENTDYLRLIVEFVAPCLSPLDLRGLGKSWMGLAAYAPSADRTYIAGLETLLGTWIPKSSAARIRMIVQSPGLIGVWASREYPFSNTGPVRSTLSQELKLDFAACDLPASDIGKFARSNTAQIIASHYTTPGSLQTQQSAINASDLFVLTLLGDQALPADQLDQVRHSLSINTCRGCHSRETSTAGFQIGVRKRTYASDLSAFLTGDPNCKRSTDTSLTSYCQVAESPLLYTPGGCSGMQAQPQSYNDLLRRHEYLDKLLNSPRAGSITWRKELSQFTAFQVD